MRRKGCLQFVVDDLVERPGEGGLEQCFSVKIIQLTNTAGPSFSSVTLQTTLQTTLNFSGLKHNLYLAGNAFTILDPCYTINQLENKNARQTRAL